jgi:hypothetical protein
MSCQGAPREFWLCQDFDFQHCSNQLTSAQLDCVYPFKPKIVNFFTMKSHELQLLLSEGTKHNVLDAPEPSGPRVQKVRRIFPGWLRAG